MVGGVSQVIVGIVVFSLLGMLLGLFVQRAEESMLGGLCGMLLGLATSSHENPVAQGEITNLCLVMGGLVGATGWPWIRLALGTSSCIKRTAIRILGKSR